MIYPALVLDTSNFLKKGTIRVRIAQYYNKGMNWDLSTDPTFINLGVNKDSGSHCDYEAYVFSPIGGGSNYGAFFLPQENTKGLIAFIGNPIERGGRCFWLGSLFEPTFSEEDGMLEKINFPSDIPGANGANSDGFVNGSLNIEDRKNTDGTLRDPVKQDLSGSLVLRLKSTKYIPEETNQDTKKKDLNWEKSNSENIVVINKDKILIHHAAEYNDKQEELSYQEITLEKDNINITLKKDILDTNKTKTTSLSLNKGETGVYGFSLSTDNKENKTSNTITSIENELLLTATQDKEVSTVIINPTSVILTAKQNTVLVDNNGVTLNAEKSNVYLTAKEVHLGPEDSRVVTTTFTDIFELPNGMILKPSDTIFG